MRNPGRRVKTGLQCDYPNLRAYFLTAFLRVLPLKVDMSENETIYNCLIGILQHPEGVKQKAEIARIFQEAVSETSKVDAETKQKIQQAMSTM